MQNRRLDPTGLAKLGDPQVDRYEAGFGPPRSSGLGFWRVPEPNRNIFLVQTQTAGGLPGPVAHTKLDQISDVSIEDQLLPRQ